MLRPGLLGDDKWAFGRDYCSSARTSTGWFAPLGSGMRDWELHLLLRDSVMVRRRKLDVMSELPPKVRTWLRLPLSGSNLHPHSNLTLIRRCAPGCACR